MTLTAASGAIHPVVAQDASARPGRWYFSGESVTLHRESNGASYFRPAARRGGSPFDVRETRGEQR